MNIHYVSVQPWEVPIDCLTKVPEFTTPVDMKNSKREEVLRARVAFRVSDAELAKWKAAADAADLTFSGWAAEILNKAVSPEN